MDLFIIERNRKLLSGEKNKKKSILYITFIEMSEVLSGSSVRPDRMYKAFLEEGHNVYLLKGSCERRNRKNRKENVLNCLKWLQSNEVDLCYFESPTYPIMYGFEYKLIKEISLRSIPMSYFYRDAYRSFDDLFPRRTGFVNTLKELYLDYLQKKTDRILHLMNVVYFPTESFFCLFEYKRMKTLPPAGECLFIQKEEITKTCIYVGGVSEIYGINLLIESFAELNRFKEEYRLILVCRKKEYLAEKNNIGEYKWLRVEHASGDELIPLYKQADIGLLTLKPNQYTDMCIGIKLFQYLSYGLPVVCTNVKAMKNIIEENEFGVIAEYDKSDYAKKIKSIIDNADKLQYYKGHVRQNIIEKHLWVHRVRQIISDLDSEI